MGSRLNGRLHFGILFGKQLVKKLVIVASSSLISCLIYGVRFLLKFIRTAYQILIY